MNEALERLERTVLHPLTHTTMTYRIVVLALAAVAGWGLYAFSIQMRNGLVVTGMRDYILWGLYISNFVFFIGISHAGTLISAILRVTKAEWRVSITRMAEFITVVALTVGGVFPIIDMGRPDRVPSILWFGRFQSPIVWDILAISTYLTGSAIYLFLPLIEDLAICRDKLPKTLSPWRRLFYRVLSVGWRGTDSQKKSLFTAMGIMAILIIPIAVSVHTVVSFIFAMTLRSGWNSTVYGIYFVAGAIFSGIATIIIVMAILRRAFHLEEYITSKQFVYLGYMLGAFVLIMAYFNLLEFLVPGYKNEEGEGFLLQSMLAGKYAWMYWAYIVAGLGIPAFIILNPRTRNVKGLVIASILVNIAMWLERFLVVVPALDVPLLPREAVTYVPTWVEWSIIAGAFAEFSLIIAVFAKLFPVISIWEVKEQMEQKEHVAAEAETSPATTHGFGERAKTSPFGT
ncbi:MAG: polysulfide reductase NrfD [Chloroflexi bacterium]|nr:polysulfide reductase NrfD [Chloroflexota bacterium]